MSSLTVLHRFIVTNLMTLYYNFLVLIWFAVKYLKNPFEDPWPQKLKLEPPTPLSDPKYGTHKYIKVNNIKLHYVESGDPTKPLMIFIHGFPEFWYSWRHQIVEFNRDYWCIAIDMRGYGDSERPDGVDSYKFDLLVEDIRDLIRQLGREKCILVTHDWGGLVGCRLRDVYPETVSALVMLASFSRDAWLHELWHNPEQRKKSWYVFLFRCPVIPEWLLQMNDLAHIESILQAPGKDTITKQDIECYKYWFRKQPVLTAAINYYRAIYCYTLPEKARCETNIPMLLVQAENDEFVSKSIVDRMKTEYAHIETTVVENCRHFIQQEEPGKVNKLIRDFLNRHEV